MEEIELFELNVLNFEVHDVLIEANLVLGVRNEVGYSVIVGLLVLVVIILLCRFAL